jgi:hypothetical protein
MSSATHADVLRSIHHFRGARDAAGPGERLREVRARAARLRGEMMAAAPVRYYRSFGLVRVPYPTKFAFLNAFSLPTPMLHIVNRLFVIQIDVQGETVTVLVSPSDVRANAETPFFKQLSAKFGPFQEGKPGYFPRAKLLVMRQEWASMRALLPPQALWYCPNGIDGIDPAKIMLLDGDVMIGESFAILHTPGHTEGNQSFVVRTPEGLMVTSENGVGPDSYAPLASKIPGLRKHALATGMEVVLNGNTLERGLDQYLSMIQEKEIAGPSARNPEFPNVVSSSELASYFAFPGIEPTFSFGDLEFGAPSRA